MKQRLLSNGSDRIDRRECRLIKRLKQKSPQAFEELVDIFASRLYSTGI